MAISDPSWLRSSLLAGGLFSVAGCTTLSTPPHSVAGQLHKTAAHYYAGTGPGAAILVIRDGQVLLREGYGMADLEHSVPIRPEAVFKIGSVTKQFTAVAILQLVEDGKLKLTDPVSQHLPEFAPQGDAISLEHLLTLTSGIVNYSEVPAGKSLSLRDASPEAITDLFRSEPVLFAPGAQWKYGNSGHILLGRIIEKVSGLSYAEYLAQHVYPRAGLTHTQYGSDTRLITARARGYSKAGDSYGLPPHLNMSYPYAAGALLSTVDDLARWTQALVEGRVISPDLLRRAWTAYRLADGTDTQYGYGWAPAQVAGVRAISHHGDIPGFSAQVVWLPELKTFVAVLMNSDKSPGRDPAFVAFELAFQANGLPFDRGGEAVAGGPLAEFVGSYVGQNARDYSGPATTVFSEDGGQLHFRFGTSKGAPAPLRRVAPDRFVMAGTMWMFQFVRGSDGAVTGVEFDRALGPIARAVRENE